jgi:hypothetical protein
MGLSKSNGPEVLNFVITGPVSGGASVIQAALAEHPLVACHASLLAECNAERRGYHEDYFGPSGNTPDWLVTGHISGEQYLTNKIFDNPLCGEKLIGVTILYPHLYAHDLWDYLTNWCRGGDFCLIQVKRNPVACFLASEQERRQAAWFPDDAAGEPLVRSPLQVDVGALISFARMQAAADEKVARICDDRLEVGYSELVNDYQSVLSDVFDFLGIPMGRIGKKGVPAGTRRDFEANSTGWQYLRSRVPSDVQKYFDHEELT